MKLPAALLLLCLAAWPVFGHRPGKNFEQETYAEAAGGQNTALSLAVLRRAELEKPKDPFAPEAEGRLLAAAGNFAGAAAKFRAALALEPFYGPARISLARALSAAGLYGECAAELDFLYGMPAVEARNEYQRALLAYDRAGLGKLKKELCVKKRTGGATAPARKTR